MRLLEAVHEEHEVDATDEEVGDCLVDDDGPQHEVRHEAGEPSDDQSVHPDWIPAPCCHVSPLAVV